MPRTAARGQAETRPEVHSENALPVVVFHPHQQAVSGNSRVVYENVHAAERLLGFGHERLRSGSVAQIAGQDMDAIAKGRGRLLERRPTRARQGHGCALRMKRGRDRARPSLRSRR